jgi:biopolymer transport protein ExbB/TolQ
LRRIGAALLAGDPDGVEHALADYEHLVQRRLDRTRVLVRAGPAVGLMGTLIPLAPGLKALGDGRVELLADDLRVAFAATVVGLLAGTIAFALTLARTRRASEDLDALERATAQLRATAAAAAHARAQAAGEAIVAREQAQVPA